MIKFKIGKKFLFLANDRNNVLSKYNNDLVNRNEIKKITCTINKLNNKNIFIINIPDKIEIYPEDLDKKNKKSFTDIQCELFYELLNNDSNLINIINLKKLFLDKKNELKDINLYWEFDSHYTFSTTILIFELLINKINNIFNTKIVIDKDLIIDKNEKSFCCDLLNHKNINNEIKKNYNHKKKEVIYPNFTFNKWKINYFKTNEGKKILIKNGISKEKFHIFNKINLDIAIKKINLKSNIIINDNSNDNLFEIIYSFGNIIGKKISIKKVKEQKIIIKYKKYLNNLFLYTKIKNNIKYKFFKKTLLLIGDSYSSMGLIHMFPLYFSEFYFVFSPDINYEFINELNPDLVIFEKASRFI